MARLKNTVGPPPALHKYFEKCKFIGAARAPSGAVPDLEAIG